MHKLYVLGSGDCWVQGFRVWGLGSCGWIDRNVRAHIYGEGVGSGTV